MIFFLLESLFQFAAEPKSAIPLKDIVKKVLANPSLTPILYQFNFAQCGTDPELDQMIAFIPSFR
jgi:hypothetical protein